MHRTTRVPCPRPWGLLIALVLPLGALSVAAQELLPAPGAGVPLVAPAVRTEIIGLNQTRRIGMTTKSPIIDLQNENPTVIRIDKVDKDPSTVFVTGTNPGVTRLVFTDINRKVEEIILRVDDSEQRRLELVELIRKVAPTAAVQVTVAPNNTVILTGYITDVDTGQRLMEVARSVFTVRNGQAVIPANVFNGMTVGGVQQVQLEVVMAVVNRSRLRQMAFSASYQDPHTIFNSILQGASNFGQTPPPNGLASAVAPGLLANSVAASGALSGTQNLIFGFLGNTAGFQAYLQALNTEGLGKILADTRLVTLSGRPASMVSGGETPILTSGGVGQSSVSYKAFGTVVSFLPIVQNGKIHLEVRPELSAINAANSLLIAGVTPTSIPGFSTRSAQVAVQLEDGQTLAIGGLIQNTINSTIVRVPVLGDIPFLDVLFTNKSYNEVEEELLILVTPRLVDGLSCCQIPKHLPGRESRSPDDFELFLEGIMEAPRGPRNLSINPLFYKGAHMLSPNAYTVPCARTPHFYESILKDVGFVAGTVSNITGIGGGSSVGFGSGNGFGFGVGSGGNTGCPSCGTPGVMTPMPVTPFPAPLPAPAPIPGPRTQVQGLAIPAEVPTAYVPQPLPQPAANAFPTSNIAAPNGSAPAIPMMPTEVR